MYLETFHLIHISQSSRTDLRGMLPSWKTDQAGSLEPRMELKQNRSATWKLHETPQLTCLKMSQVDPEVNRHQIAEAFDLNWFYSFRWTNTFVGLRGWQTVPCGTGAAAGHVLSQEQAKASAGAVYMSQCVCVCGVSIWSIRVRNYPCFMILVSLEVLRCGCVLTHSVFQQQCPEDSRRRTQQLRSIVDLYPLKIINTSKVPPQHPRNLAHSFHWFQCRKIWKPFDCPLRSRSGKGLRVDENNANYASLEFVHVSWTEQGRI